MASTNKQLIFDVLAVAEAKGFSEAAREVDKLSRSADNVGKSSKNLGLLSTAIVGLAPALVPVGAAAVAAGIGLTGMGAAGLLAFRGLSAQWKTGTLQATALGRQIGFMASDIRGLQSTAARNVAPGLTDALKTVDGLMPTVNQDIGTLSSKLGDIVSHVAPGFVRLFIDANPLLLDFADYLDTGAQKFDQWTASSDGAKKFIGYAQLQLPKVESIIGDLATTTGHLVTGLAPLGGTTLTTIKLFTEATSHIPIGVIQALAPALAGLKIASTVNAGLGNLSTKLSESSGWASKLSPLVSSIGSAAFVAAPLVLTLATAFGQDQAKTQLAAQQTQAFTDALKASHGALNQNIRDLVATDLQQSGALDSARKLGLNLSDLTSAALGDAGALARVTDRGKALGLNLTSTGQVIVRAGQQGRNLQTVNQGLARDYGVVIGAVGGQSAAMQKALSAYRNTTAAAASSAGSVHNLSGEIIKIPGYRTSKIQVNSAQALRQLADYKDHLSALNGATAYTYIQQVVLGQQQARNKQAAMAGIRDAGGPVTAGAPYLIGLNRRPEVFVPQTNGHIYPLSSSSRAGAPLGNLTVYVTNPDPTAVVRVLERWVGGGGRIAGVTG